MPFVMKTIAGVLLVAVLGVPMVDTWRVLLLAAGLLAIGCSDVDSRGWRRVAAAAAIAMAVMAARSALPRADIAEGHNIFLVFNQPDVFDQLPAQIYTSWQAQFDALYPPNDPPRGDGFSHVDTPPTMPLYAWSADSVWRPAKYSRQVDAISFRSVSEFRGGFANGTIGDAAGTYVPHNYSGGTMFRETAPFWVMYELTPASVGSRLRWKGQIFWERADGGFDEVVHPEPAARTIASEDAGRRVFAVFFSTPGRPSFDVPQYELDFKLELSRALQWSAWTNSLLTIVAWVSILALTVRVRWPLFMTAASIFAVSYAVIAAFIAVSLGKFLGRDYMPLGGGDDGLIFELYGRIAAMHLSRWEIVEALKGSEPLFWFQPGLRYFRMVEKVIFGDTYHLYALACASMPILIFFLIRHFTTARWAWLATAAFCTMVVGGFSLLQYVRFAKLGYGEPIGVVLFLFGLLVLLRSEPRWGGQQSTPRHLWLGGLAFALSVFIRPNYILAVAWISAAYAWASWRRNDVATIAALAAGLAFTAVMPLHNWYYGGEFILLSKSGSTSAAMAFGVGDYVRALGELVTGRIGEGSTFAVLFAKLRLWLFDPGANLHTSLGTVTRWLHPVKLFALAVTIWVAARSLSRRPAAPMGLAIVAMAALLSLVPVLFSSFTTFRYTMFGWDLSLMVTIVWVARSTRFNQLVDRGLRQLEPRRQPSGSGASAQSVTP